MQRLCPSRDRLQPGLALACLTVCSVRCRLSLCGLWQCCCDHDCALLFVDRPRRLCARGVAEACIACTPRTGANHGANTMFDTSHASRQKARPSAAIPRAHRPGRASVLSRGMVMLCCTVVFVCAVVFVLQDFFERPVDLQSRRARNTSVIFPGCVVTWRVVVNATWPTHERQAPTSS